MERLPVEHGDVLPAFARREELHRRKHAQTIPNSHSTMSNKTVFTPLVLRSLWRVRVRRARRTKWCSPPAVPTSSRCWRYMTKRKRHPNQNIRSHFRLTGKPLETSDHHPEGRHVQPPASDPRVHVRRRGERLARAAAGIPAHRRPAEGQGPGRNARTDEAGGLIVVRLPARYRERARRWSTHHHTRTHTTRQTRPIPPWRQTTVHRQCKSNFIRGFSPGQPNQCSLFLCRCCLSARRAGIDPKMRWMRCLREWVSSECVCSCVVCKMRNVYPCHMFWLAGIDLFLGQRCLYNVHTYKHYWINL